MVLSVLMVALLRLPDGVIDIGIVVLVVAVRHIILSQMHHVHP